MQTPALCLDRNLFFFWKDNPNPAWPPAELTATDAGTTSTTRSVHSHRSSSGSRPHRCPVLHDNVDGAAVYPDQVLSSSRRNPVHLATRLCFFIFKYYHYR